jgi:pimeloyl-ACP methyl ester carboxylesterase
MTEFFSIACDGWKLNGIVHLPTPEPSRRIGVVLLHENINTKFGTHRLLRQVAEALAEAGFYVLRYDDRGTCDSPGECELTVSDRVADACAVFTAFRRQYQLDALISWGLCMGAAVAVLSTAKLQRKARPEAMILCSILADPAIVSGAEFGYEPVNVSAILRSGVLKENPVRKLCRVVRNFCTVREYRSQIRKVASLLAKRYFGGETGLRRRRREISRVSGLLAACQEPCLMVFGERDPYWANFTLRVNPNDKLGLTKKSPRWDWVLVRDGDHTFASAEQTEELIRYTIEWAQAFRDGSPASIVGLYPEHMINGIFATSAVE